MMLIARLLQPSIKRLVLHRERLHRVVSIYHQRHRGRVLHLTAADGGRILRSSEHLLALVEQGCALVVLQDFWVVNIGRNLIRNSLTITIFLHQRHRLEPTDNALIIIMVLLTLNATAP